MSEHDTVGEHRYALAANGDVLENRLGEYAYIGKWYDLAAQIRRLEAECERLRAMLPSAEVREALEECIRMHEHIMFIDETNTLARGWLDSLESESEE